MMSMEWPQLPSRYFTSEIACSCPDFLYRGRYRACKHVRALREALAVLDATNAKWATRNTVK